MSEGLGIIEQIVFGAADDILDGISRAVKDRRTVLDGVKIYTLKAGDVVRFNSKTRPKYLQGLKAEVVRVNKTRVVVRIVNADSRARKYAYEDFTTPIALIDRVEA